MHYSSALEVTRYSECDKTEKYFNVCKILNSPVSKAGYLNINDNTFKSVNICTSLHLNLSISRGKVTILLYFSINTDVLKVLRYICIYNYLLSLMLIPSSSKILLKTA